MSIIYEIATKISMRNEVNTVLIAIGKEIEVLKGKLSGLSAGFEKMGHNAKVALIGGGVTGFAIVDGFIKATEHAGELLKVQNQLAISGVSQLEIAEATAKAYEVQQKYGVKVAEVVKDIRELRMPLGSTAHAVDFIEDLERMRIVLNTFQEGTGDKAKEALYAAARSGELMGLKTNEDFRNLFQAETQAITASGGKITPQGFLAAAQYGRVAAQGWTPEFVDKWLPTLIQEQTGMQAGTGLMSMFRNLAQGHTPLATFRKLQEFGLITDESKLIPDKKGGFKGFTYGAIERSDLLVKNPYEWTQEVLAPALRKKFGDDVASNDPRIIGAIGDLLSQRTAAGVAAIMTLQPRRFEKDAKLIGETMGTKGADYLIKHDLYASMNRFTSALDALLTKLGGPLVGPATDALNHLADALNKLADGWLITKIDGLGDQITSAFKAMFDKIGEWIPEWLKGWALKQKASFESGGDAGGLIQKASYGGGGGGGGGTGAAIGGAAGGFSAGGTGTPGSLTALITAEANRAGIDPRIMEGIRAGESGHGSKYDIKDDAMESSWGPFQLNRRRGLGVEFERDTALERARLGLGNLKDPRTIPLQARWVAEYIKRHHGTNSQWMGYHGPRDASPSWGESGYVRPYSGKGKEVHAQVHTNINLDGKLLASNVVTHVLKSSEHSRGAAYFDGYGTFAGADRQTATA